MRNQAGCCMALTSDKAQATGFIGRHQELATLTDALDDAVAGRGRLVMLAGEPGIGKTRITRELAGLAEQRGAKVLWGWCYEQSGAPPYWPWIQAIRSYAEKTDSGQLRQQMGAGATDISGILPELLSDFADLEPPAVVDPEQARFRLFVSVSAFLSAVGRTQPLVLVLEDLHWADESSLMLLEFLLHDMGATSIMVIGTYRSAEVTGRHPLARTLGGLVREDLFRRVELTGLTRQEVGEFISTRSGVAIPEETVDALHQRTDGNPLLVGEVVGSVSTEQMAQDRAWLDSIPGPSGK